MCDNPFSLCFCINSIIVFSPAASKPTLERIAKWYESKGFDLIITKPLLAEEESENENS